MRFPILVQAEAEIKIRLSFEPDNVRDGFGSGGLAVLAVEVQAGGVFAPIQRKAAGIQTGAEPKVQICRPRVVCEQLADGQRAGRFVAVDAGGNINAECGLRSAE